MIYINKFFHEKNIFFILSMSLIVFGWFVQENLFLNWDVAVFLQITQSVLSGGQYMTDFFNPNLPGILFIYMPAVIISKLLHFNIIFVLRAYLFLVIGISLLLCVHLSEVVFLKHDKKIRYLFLIILTTLFYIFPFHNFAQREYLSFVFVIPYLLGVVGRLQGNDVSTPLSILIGFLVGLDCTLKPYFLMIPLFVEIYFFFSKKDFFSWCRVEVITLIFVLLAYAFIIPLYFKNYLFLVLPYLLRFHHYSNVEPFIRLITPVGFWASTLPIFLYLIQYHTRRYKALTTILLIALLSYLGIFLIQGTLFSYHIVPAIFLAFLLQFLLLSSYITQLSLKKRDYFLLIPFTVFVLFFYQTINSWDVLLFDPIEFFLFLFILYFSLFFFLEKKIHFLNVFVKTVFVTGTCFGISYLARHTPWGQQGVAMSIFLSILLAALLSKNTNYDVVYKLVVLSVGAASFVFLSVILIETYFNALDFKKEMLEPLAQFMKSQKRHSSIYVFSQGVSYDEPLAFYLNLTPVHRSDGLWMLSGLLRANHYKTDASLIPYFKNETHSLFMNMIVEDLHEKKPNLIFVDTRKYNIYSRGNYFYFNYLFYFLQNKKFKNEWKHYRYLTTIEKNRTDYYPYISIFKLDVYQREDA